MNNLSVVKVGLEWSSIDRSGFLWFLIIGCVVLCMISFVYFYVESSRFVIKWSLIIGLSVYSIGLAAILLPMASFLSPKVKNSNQSQFFSSRPDYFPDVLIPHRQAIQPTYVLDPPGGSARPYILWYSLPENSSPEQIRDDLNALYKEHGYIQLAYSLDEPNKLLEDCWNNHWIEATTYEMQYDTQSPNSLPLGIRDEDWIEKKSWRYARSYFQYWIRLMPDVSSGFLGVYYIWQEDKLESGSVSADIGYISDIGKVLNYADIHPDAFNLIDLDCLRMQAVFKPEACNYLCVEGNDDHGS